jgi:hypothetical protein
MVNAALDVGHGNGLDEPEWLLLLPSGVRAGGAQNHWCQKNWKELSHVILHVSVEGNIE